MFKKYTYVMLNHIIICLLNTIKNFPLCQYIVNRHILYIVSFLEITEAIHYNDQFLNSITFDSSATEIP